MVVVWGQGLGIGTDYKWTKDLSGVIESLHILHYCNYCENHSILCLKMGELWCVNYSSVKLKKTQPNK